MTNSIHLLSIVSAMLMSTASRTGYRNARCVRKATSGFIPTYRAIGAGLAKIGILFCNFKLIFNVFEIFY